MADSHALTSLVDASTVQLKALNSKSIFNITDDDIDYAMSLDWSDRDKTRYNFDKIMSLPVHLQYFEFDLQCAPSRDWFGNDHNHIPGNSRIFLHSHVGTMNMGWNRLVDPTGRFIDNGEILRAFPGDFTVSPDCNAFCFLVSPGLKSWLRNSTIPTWGASVGDLSVYWNIGPDEGGTAWTAFCDTDSNNSGGFLQKLRIVPPKSFAQYYYGLRKQGKLA